MESDNLFRITLADEHLGDQAQFELIDSIDPDSVTRAALGNYLELRLRRDRLWPAEDVRLVNIEWQAVIDDERPGSAVTLRRSDCGDV
jgi:hypothetical protein